MTDAYEALRQKRLAAVSADYRAMIAGWPDLAAIGVQGLREVIAAGTSRVPVSPDVNIHDVEVAGPAGPVPCRIYTPRQAKGPLGVTMHVHFGGFVAGGGIGTMDGIHAAIAAAVPCVVVAPDFRLPPEHKFPAGLQDCWAVLNWIAREAAHQGWNERIAVGGGCTGGNFAAVLALMARDYGGPDISLQFLQAWPADCRCDTVSQHDFAEGYGLRYTDNRWVVSQYVTSESEVYDWRVSPILADSVKDVAPAFISVGEWDILRDEDLQYGNRLRDAGVPLEVHVWENEGHVGDPATRAKNDAILHNALRRALTGEQ